MKYQELYPQVKIDYSYGRGKYGQRYVYIRPAFQCHNRSRRIKADNDKIESTIKKYYTPCNYYIIEGDIIGASNEKLALKEYWKICDKAEIKKNFAVHPITEIFEGSMEKQLTLLHYKQRIEKIKK